MIYHQWYWPTDFEFNKKGPCKRKTNCNTKLTNDDEILFATDLIEDKYKNEKHCIKCIKNSIKRIKTYKTPYPADLDELKIYIEFMFNYELNKLLKK
jgi:hypothetical protein